MSSESIRSTRPVLRIAALANDRLKSGRDRTVWGAVALSVAVHAALLVYSPKYEAETVEFPSRFTNEPVQFMDLDQLFLPPAPERASETSGGARAEAPPASSETVTPAPAPEVDDLLAEVERQLATAIAAGMGQEEAGDEFALPGWGDFMVSGELGPPPSEMAGDEWLEYRRYAAYVVRPEIRNRAELTRFLQRNYQPIYQFSGVTGVVQVAFWIDEGGKVERAEIAKSSGSRTLDRLALRLSRVLRFRPAMMAGKPVRIVVHLPITFRAA